MRRQKQEIIIQNYHTFDEENEDCCYSFCNCYTNCISKELKKEIKPKFELNELYRFTDEYAVISLYNDGDENNKTVFNNFIEFVKLFENNDYNNRKTFVHLILLKDLIIVCFLF